MCCIHMNKKYVLLILIKICLMRMNKTYWFISEYLNRNLSEIPCLNQHQDMIFTYDKSNENATADCQPRTGST